MLNTHSFSHQARHAVSPLVVQAFNHAGLAAAFFTRTMLPRSQELGVGFVKVGVHQLCAISRRHLPPQFLQRFLTAVAHFPRQNLMSQSRNDNPQVTITPFEAIANHQLVNFQSVALDRSQQRAGETQPRLSGLFFKTTRTVSRLTPKVRAIARCDSRSPSAFSINTSFSGLKTRLLPSGVHVLRQSLHCKRCDPPRLKPHRTTRAL